MCECPCCMPRHPVAAAVQAHTHAGSCIVAVPRSRAPEHRHAARRYVPFYVTQTWADLGAEGRCKPFRSEAAQNELIAQFWADAPALLPLLGSKPHWMQLSEVEYFMHRGCGEGWGIPLACHPLAAHMTFATPEALTELHPTHWRQRFFGHAPAYNNSLAIPYLGHIHRVSLQARAQQLAGDGVATEKQFLASMSFGSMREAWLRKNLTEQCINAPEECWYLEYSSFEEVLNLYRAAWFCVQPYGDSPTRSALLDCLASGLAVPAVFDEFLFDMLPFADVLDYRSMLAYVPEEDVLPPDGNLLQRLRAFSTDARMAMLLNVQRASHALQYAVRTSALYPCFMRQ